MLRHTLSLVVSLFVLCCGMSAAEPFVTFTSQSDALSLKGATIGYAAQEYEGVKMAIQNLRQDMQRVLGSLPAESSDAPTILSGTVGKNKEIDKL